MTVQNTPIILDIEASGFGRGSYPIEVGFALENGETKCTLIKPEPGWAHWDASSEALHGISRDILEKHGKPVQWVAKWLNEHLRGRDVFSDAWGNDMCWLGLLFEFAEIPQLFHLEALTKLLSEQQMKQWATLRKKTCERLELRRHRASSDALVIQKTYLQSLMLDEMPRPAVGR